MWFHIWEIILGEKGYAIVILIDNYDRWNNAPLLTRNKQCYKRRNAYAVKGKDLQNVLSKASGGRGSVGQRM